LIVLEKRTASGVEIGLLSTIHNAAPKALEACGAPVDA
jgi:hypothetical protein